MASDPFAPIPAAETHLSECADFTLIERLRKDSKIVYRCSDCDYRFTEDHPDVEALKYDAFQSTVPVVHPSKYRPGV